MISGNDDARADISSLPSLLAGCDVHVRAREAGIQPAVATLPRTHARELVTQHGLSLLATIPSAAGNLPAF